MMDLYAETMVLHVLHVFVFRREFEGLSAVIDCVKLEATLDWK